MVSKTHTKRQRDIRSKLMAAVAMLLVSSIMMVSSTYAWFTLSTAPEVTGINTAVGANGNLEMALVPAEGLSYISSAAGDGILPLTERNTTWGNLVELSNGTEGEVYGLDKITLYPAKLNLTETGAINSASYLQTPAYGADGRVSELLENTQTGIYNSTEKNFYPDSYYGVRAVGAASGMTPRQLDYRNSRAAANTSMSLAQTLAAQSLNTNGSALANIAIKHGTSDGTEKYDADDKKAMETIVADLDVILGHIENAYMQSILGLAASQKGSETAWSAVKGEVEKDGATLASVLSLLTTNNVSMDANGTAAIGQYNDMLDDVAEAKTSLAAMTADANGNYTWDQVSAVLTKLADPTAMVINGIKASEIKQGDNMSTLVNGVASSGLTVTIASGGGVYADVADQCGDFSASVVIEEVTYNSLTLKNMNARMNTKSSITTPYLTLVSNYVADAKAPESEGGTALPISDMYGYVIDLAFRTNAAESNLLLQVEAADRIYDDNTNEQTMGGGSSMTFAATTTDFTNAQVLELMSAIRIVFFDPTTHAILTHAKLDTENAVLGTDGYTADMYLYTPGIAGTITVTYEKLAADDTTYTGPVFKQVENVTYELIAEGETVTDKYDADGTANADGQYKKVTTTEYVLLTDAELTTYTGDKYKPAGNTTSPTADEKSTDNVITALAQNTAKAVSVLVYLDGEQVTNANVAATAPTSLTGSMNLQFASSANLVPMEYADLHIAGEGTTAAATYAVTFSGENCTAAAATGYDAAKVTAGGDFKFTVTAADGYQVDSVKVGETTLTATDGVYTIDKVEAATTVTITTSATT